MNPKLASNAPLRVTSRSASSSSGSTSTSAFTLVEMLISVTILALLMIVLTSFTDAAHRAWRQGQSHTEAFQSARTSLEIMARELNPAVVDTRMQFVIGPTSILSSVGATNLAPNTPVLLWMSPLGPKGDLRCVGYYLYRDEVKKFYRLKRLHISPFDTNNNPSPYFPKMVNPSNPNDPELRTSPTDALWFTRSWDENTFNDDDPNNTAAAVSSAADGVIAFWAQPLDLLGNPIPWITNDNTHPASNLTFNSAAYFQVATSQPFENGKSFSYMAQTPQTLKANRLPAAIDLTVITIDNAILDQGFVPPTQNNFFTEEGALDLKTSLEDYQKRLRSAKIFSTRTFTTRAILINGN